MNSTIILAAGSSQRMGTVKALLPINGMPMIECVVRAFQQSGVTSEIVVVTGFAADEIAAVVQPLGCSVAHNSYFAEGGMWSSVKAGLAACDAGLPVFVALVDQPMIRAETIAAVARAFDESSAEIVVPRFNGKRGHPVLFSASCRAEILALPADAMLKEVVHADPQRLLQLDLEDPAIVSDLDTPDDYARATRL